MINSLSDATGHAKRRLGPLFNKCSHVYVSPNGDVWAGNDSEAPAATGQELFAVKGEPIVKKQTSKKKEEEDVTK